MQALNYTPLEWLRVPRPVERIPYLVGRCRGKAVLDLGCYDETALGKRDTPHWLHGALAQAARSVLGVDGSAELPAGGLTTGPRSRIVRGDAMDLEKLTCGEDVDAVVAGELMEHLPNPLAFLSQIRRLFPGRELLVSTPNATSLTNVLLGIVARESSHHDHLQVFSFKTLNTLCLRAGFTEWQILPYHVYYTEMALRSGALRRAVVQAAESAVNFLETLFPLLSGGLILDVRRL